MSQPGLDQQRGARVSEAVKADAGQPGALGGRDEPTTAQAALMGRGTVAAWKDERVVFGAARTAGSQQGGKLGGQRDEPRAVAGLRGDERALDDCAAHLQMRRVAVQDEVAPAQTDRLRDPQPGRGQQLKQRTPLGRDLIEQTHELSPSEVAPLAYRPGATGAAPREYHLLRRVGVQKGFGDRSVEVQT